MENKKLIESLKERELNLYTFIMENIENITKEQLKDIILSLYIQVPNYITSPIIQKHFYSDLIKDLENTWKET